MQFASSKTQSMTGASHQLVFMGHCLFVTRVHPVYLVNRSVSMQCQLLWLNHRAWVEVLTSLLSWVTAYLLVAWALPCLPGEWVSFCVPGTIEVDGVCVWTESGRRYTLLPKVYPTLGNDNRVWEQSPCKVIGRWNEPWARVGIRFPGSGEREMGYFPLLVWCRYIWLNSEASWGRKKCFVQRLGRGTCSGSVLVYGSGIKLTVEFIIWQYQVAWWSG